MPQFIKDDKIIVRIKDVCKVCYRDNARTDVLKNINLDINTGEYISIMGASGSGKTTLFNIIAGLDKPTSGRVYIDEVGLANLNSNELALMRNNNIGFIFQSFNLLPGMTVHENVCLPLLFKATPKRESLERGAVLLARLGLGHRLNFFPYEISWGEQQRVAIARSLINQPSLILADEPTGNLDLNSADEIMDVLEERHAAGATVVTVTRDMKMLNVSDRVVWIRNGMIEKIERQENTDITVTNE